MNAREIESYKKAGKVAVAVKKYAREIIKPGMKLIDIALKIDDKIKELGAEPAFPVNLSLNEIAAHFTPEMNSTEVVEGLLKVDTGIHVNGYIADTAITLDFTEDKRHSKMIELNKNILNNIIKIVKPGMFVKEIGKVASKTLEEFNKKNKTKFSMVRNLCGHNVEKDVIHGGLIVQNVDNENSTILKDITIAVEPFVTTGSGEIYEGKGGGIYGLQSDSPTRDRNSREVLKFIKENYNTRPFCTRWLEKAGLKNVKFAMKNLVEQGIVHHYPLLIEKTKEPVSQFENTFLIMDDEVVVTTFEEGWMEK